MSSDPQGKRALFDPSPGSDAERAIRPTVQTGQAGRRALFSAGERQPGTVLVQCEQCRSTTRVSLVEFGFLHLPFWLWIPGKAYSRLLRCPACEDRTWVKVRFFS